MDTTLRITHTNDEVEVSQNFVVQDYEYPADHRQAIADYLDSLRDVAKIEVGDGTNFIELQANNLTGLNLANMVVTQRAIIRF